MLPQIILYVSIFLFGYFTCLVFYLGKSGAFYISIIKTSLALSLFIVARALEHMSYAKEFRYNEMKKSGDTEHNLKAVNTQFEYEIDLLKNRFIKELRGLQKATQYAAKFNDWDGAMTFLAENKQLVLDAIKNKEGN